MAQEVNKNHPKKFQNRVTKVEARRRLTPADRLALPFLGKKNTDPKSPNFGKWQEDCIVQHIIARLKLSDSERKIRVDRMSEIDIQLSGVTKLSDDRDQKRDKENKQGSKAQPVEANIPLAYSQIDDCVTYCMSLFAPEANIFVATSTAKKQGVAEGLTKEIGKQGQTLMYYRQLARVVLNALKYNFGGFAVRWETQTGIVFKPDEKNAIAGSIKQTEGTVWEGNVLKSVNCYNFLYDTSVHPVDLPLRGEYYAEVELQTPFRAKRMEDQKILFGVDRFIDEIAPYGSSDGSTFYVAPPVVRERLVDRATSGTTNWVQFMSADGSQAKDSRLGLEFVWYTGWVRPYKLGLSESKKLEVWQLCMVNGRYIAHATHLDVTHGQLPCAIATPIEDDLDNNQRTFAEMLLPLQHFASFLLNTHVAATRKAIYGITVFDSALFPGIDLGTDDLIGARIPMKSSGAAVDIDKAFRHYNEAPATDQNVEMVGKIVELMQKILPTNQAQQVADLERATEYQAAATVQASSRRNLKIARLINDQCLSVVKFQMMYNIYQKINVIEYTDADGKPAKITPKDLLEAAIEFDIGTGLKGLDRLMQVSIFKDIMSYLFQVKDIGAQVDLLGLLSYVTQLAGFETDLSEFRLAAPTVAGVGHNGGPALDEENPEGAPAAASAAPATAA